MADKNTGKDKDKGMVVKKSTPPKDRKDSDQSKTRDKDNPKI